MVQVGGEVGGSSIAVIARQMDMIRDQFIAEVFDTMKNEIQGLDYDSRMLDMWEASITEPGLVGGSLLVPTDEREARLWFSVWEDRAGDPSRLRAAFESAGIRARLACGQTADGLRGFRASLKQAELVKAVVHAGGARRGARVVCYDDVAPIALIAGDVVRCDATSQRCWVSSASTKSAMSGYARHCASSWCAIAVTSRQPKRCCCTATPFSTGWLRRWSCAEAASTIPMPRSGCRSRWRSAGGWPRRC